MGLIIDKLSLCVHPALGIGVLIFQHGLINIEVGNNGFYKVSSLSVLTRSKTLPIADSLVGLISSFILILMEYAPEYSGMKS